MNSRQIFLTIYTLFATITFFKASEYWFGAIYFIVCTVLWFKIKRRVAK